MAFADSILVACESCDRTNVDSFAFPFVAAANIYLVNCDNINLNIFIYLMSTIVPNLLLSPGYGEQRYWGGAHVNVINLKKVWFPCCVQFEHHSSMYSVRLSPHTMGIIIKKMKNIKIYSRVGYNSVDYSIDYLILL